MTRHVEGTILTGESYEPIDGRVVIEDGKIAAVEEVTDMPDRIVAPAFVNAHTHIGDSIAKDAGRGLSLSNLVAPPDGLKHRLLRDASHEEMIEAMHQSLRYMQSTGTATCLEFREGGAEGVKQIRVAAADLDISPVVLGRETVEVIEVASGFGASGANDDDFTAEREATARADKLFGIHAGEPDSTDITPAMNLEPDFLVHMVHPTDAHLKRLVEENLPVVVCPRSNMVTGVGFPPVEDLVERTTVALGTDNVMMNNPSMFREMAFLAKHSGLTATEVLRMATRNGAEIAGLNYGVIEPGREAKLVVLDATTDNLIGTVDPLRSVVRRASKADVETVLL